MGTNKRSINQAAKGNYTAPSSGINQQQLAKERASMSIKDRRAAAKESGMSMKDYKKGNSFHTQQAGKEAGRMQAGGSKNWMEVNNSGSNNQQNDKMSPWDRMNANFNQGEWNQYVKDTFGPAGGKPTLPGSWGENGFKMDANNPMAIPKLGEYGFKRGDYAFDVDGFTPHKLNMDGRGGAYVTGRIAYVKKNGEVIPEFDGNGANPNWDKYAASGSARMSSEGLYQDRYNVGYHGADDEGEQYASTANLGDIGSYFKGYNTGEKSFGEAYNSWAGSNRKEGYAGDVLKMIDNGGMKVSDDDYNMLVTDAKNYDWDHRGKIDGKDAHGGGQSYDARAGGQSQKNITANENFYKNRNAGYHQAGSMDHQQAIAKYGNSNQSASYNSGPSEYGSQNQSNSNSNQSNTSGFTREYSSFNYQPPQQQSYTNPWSKSSKPNKTLNIDFNFDPNRFNQGQ
jgi:hypothetical protein